MNIFSGNQTNLVSLRLFVLLILISHLLSGCEKKSTANNSKAKEFPFPSKSKLLTEAYLPDKGTRNAKIEVILKRTDATVDEGWDSEVVSDAAHKRLEELWIQRQAYQKYLYSLCVPPI